MRDEPLNAPRAATLQNVLEALAEQFAAGVIESDVYRQARSAVLCYCKAAGKPPHKCKADIVELLDQMDAKSALKAGYLPDRWSNLKSLLRRALNLAGNATKRARRDQPLSAVWTQLLNECGDMNLQTRLRPLAGYCTDRQIEPPGVDEAVLQAYEAEMRQVAKSKNPTDAMKKLRKCWNTLVDNFPNTLTFRAHTPRDQRRWSLYVEDMPKPYQEDIALLRKARSPATFEEVFRCRPLKNDKAVDGFIAQIMRITTVMVRNGHKVKSFTSLRPLCLPENFEATMRSLKKQTGTAELRNLAPYVSVIHWLAENWVKLGTVKMRELKAKMSVVGHRKAEISDSSLVVLEQLDDPIKAQRVNNLAKTIFAEFRAKGEAATTSDALNFSYILFFELGLTTGWRPSSRARIDLEKDITWRGTKARPIATLKAGSITEKTELRLVVELPVETSVMVRGFIDRARPLLIAKEDYLNSFLFPGRRHGQHMTMSHLGAQSEKLIALRTRVVGMTAHKSRHSSVKFHLAQNPGDWDTVQEHVGHRDVETTKRIYANVTQVESSKRVQKSMGKR